MVVIDNSAQGFWLLKIQRANLKLTTEWSQESHVTRLIEKLREYCQRSPKVPLTEDEKSEWLQEFVDDEVSVIQDKVAEMDIISSSATNPLISLSHHTQGVPEIERKNLLKAVKDEYVTRGLKTKESEFISYKSKRLMISTSLK